MMPQSFDLYLRDSINNPNGSSRNQEAVGKPLVLYSKDSNQTVRYKIWVYLDGNAKDLFYVDSVVYYLHHSFPNPIVKVERSVSNPMCALEIETWGVFALKAEVFMKSGERIVLEHELTYDRDIQNPNAQFEMYK